MALKPASAEQEAVVRALAAGNAAVDAVAGSGKTTTALHVAARYPARAVLLLTYNARLKTETRERVAALGLDNMRVDSLHSFCVRHYDPGAYTDKRMQAALARGAAPRDAFAFDLVIVDEAQDLTPLYRALVLRLVADNGAPAPPLLCVMGDRSQSIYEYNGADARHLTLADRVFAVNGAPWARLRLSETFRVPPPVARFLNRCCLHEARLVARGATRPHHHPPTLIECGYDVAPVFHHVRALLSGPRAYRPGDIFVLAPKVGVRRGHPLKRLENWIKTGLPGVDVFVPVSDEDRMDADVIRNKLTLTTFHQSKGLERKVVYVFSFDASYLAYYKRDWCPRVRACPNELYVACTRATERLVLVKGRAQADLPFLLPSYREYLRVLRPAGDEEDAEGGDDDAEAPEPAPDSGDRSVTQLTRNLTRADLDAVLPLIRQETLAPAGCLPRLDLPAKARQGGGRVEAVGEITGAAIPLAFEHACDAPGVAARLAGVPGMPPGLLAPDRCGPYDAPRFLEAANRAIGHASGLLFKVKQVRNYDWLGRDALRTAVRRLEACVRRHAGAGAAAPAFEVPRQREEALRGRRCTLHGATDVEAGDTVFEVKCVRELDDVHAVQLALYMWLVEGAEAAARRRYVLFNVVDGHEVAVSAEPADLRALVAYLFFPRPAPAVSDADFLLGCGGTPPNPPRGAGSLGESPQAPQPPP